MAAETPSDSAFTPEQRDRLRQLARDAIAYGLEHGNVLPVTLDEWPEELVRLGACFVTLKKHGQLRGCIGSIEAHRPLVQDVANNAFMAAFRDVRFEPVGAAELDELELSLSVLGALQPIEFGSTAELATLLRPRIDGVVLQAGGYRSVFLPQVWEQLPDPMQFLHHLKLKAAMPVATEPPELRAWRYQVEAF